MSFYVLNAVWGWFLPLIVEWVNPSWKKWKVMLIAIGASLVSGYISVGIDQGFSFPMDVPRLMEAFGIILMASSTAWKMTWHDIIYKK
jgi:hypothetical protein